MTARSSITGESAEAIARSVEEGLASGRLSPGDMLPTVRGLASGLSVSPTTVASAYAILRRRGLATGQGRRGTRLVHREGAVARLPIPVAAGAVNLAGGNPSAGLLPDLDPVLARLRFGRGLYGEAGLVPELAEAGRRLLEAEGVPSSSLTVTSGAMDAIERILSTQCRPGDRVAVEDPAFAGVLDLVAVLGLEAVPVALDDEGPSPEALRRVLERGVEAFVVTPRAQNPTGAALSAARAASLSRELDRHPSVLVLEDDHAAGVAGTPRFSLWSRRRARWAAVRSFAKALGPDLRVALVSGSPDVVARVEARQAVGMRWVSRLLQRLAAAAVADRGVNAAVSRAEKEYAKRRGALVAALASRSVRAGGASGLNVWIPVREETASVQALAAAGWSVAPGERFRLRSGPGIRVTVGNLEPRFVEPFADAVAAALRPARASGAA